MQLNDRYLDEFAFRYRNGIPFDPFRAEDSLSVGIRHLSVLRRNTESWRGALIAYNCGLSRYKRGDAPASSERYADRILEGEN
jgi:hypothetical protein